ncbi:MAG: hypothetical protein A3H49_01930 [Nitrospirae bacterium RIFCSPLOWO2_02_FULL_62_14]|nr:MAG: hypothetical protein A3H49_01930 [Nitrospirae bacterium RIFCSPLOWO2_02_FULL_62_14]
MCDGHVAQVIKQGDKLARRGVAQSPFPSSEHTPQLGAQSRQFVNLPIQVSEFPLEEIPDCATWGTSGAVPPKDFGQLMKRETCMLSRGYPLEVLHVTRIPQAIPGRRALRPRHDSDSLIDADTIRSHASDSSKLADCIFLRRHACPPLESILDLGTVSKVKRVILDPQSFLSYKETGIRQGLSVSFQRRC